jgi:beta-phosphoglucomutase family hydrolase
MACLFDLDGVITQTATVHARAWKQVFDGFHIRFELPADYDAYVDGKPRADGVRSVLEARHIEPDEDLVERIAARKDQLFMELVHRDGVQTYPGSIEYLNHVRGLGKKIAVVSSSKHTTDVLKATRLDHFFDAQVDGNVAERERLHGKPNPDTYLRAAQMLGTKPENAAIYEDALAGVEAGRAGRFGRVIGVDRAGQAAALAQHGADVVVKDLAELIQTAA